MTRDVSDSGFLFAGTAALEEDAQILKVIEAYCTSAKTRQTLNSSKNTHHFTHTCTCARHVPAAGCCLCVGYIYMPFFTTGVLN